MYSLISLTSLLCLFSASGVQLLERYLPAIEELYLAQNDLSDLPKPSDLTETLEQVPDVSIEGDNQCGTFVISLIMWTGP